MNTAELKSAIAEINAAFPSLKRRMEEAPRVVDEWNKMLRPLARALVSEGVSRWIFKSNHEPSMEQFLDFLDDIAMQRRQEAAREPVTFEQVAPLSDDRVPVDEVKQLLADLYKKFDQRTLELEAERRSPSGPWRWGRRIYRDGTMGPVPGWDPEAPMMSYEEARATEDHQ